MNAALLAALAEGSAVVTPNRRLARVLHREFDLAQRAAGRSAWRTPTILPYPVWLEMLWTRVRESDVSVAPLLLSATQAWQLWRRIVEGENLALLDREGAARLAMEAWSLVHEWGAGGESWRAWRGILDESDDAAVFARWAQAYVAQLQRAGAHDLARLPGVLVGLADRVAPRCEATVLVAFDEPTPQQERLCAALLAAGARIDRLDTLPAEAALPCRILAASPGDELDAALDWARVHVAQRPQARIGIVIEDLAARRDEVAARAQARLCPEKLLPGAAAGSPPFEISLGVALASLGLVLTALDLLTLAQSRLAAGAAAALLRSPYLPFAEESWAVRARVERKWLDNGWGEVSLADAIAALESCSPDLARRWRDGRNHLPRSSGASPRHWADAWRAWLLAAGWPGSRPLDSSEFQAREAWERLLVQFAGVGAVTPSLNGASAIELLRALARETIFQPQGSDAPIQILGVLEGAGLTFDALWIAGLAADRWPRAPAPNPLLPLAWQRERNVPRASAQRELAYAQALTARFARAAPEVVFSSAASAEDHELAPSALILVYPQRPASAATATWIDSIAQSAALEAIDDERAPPPAPKCPVPGGSRILAAQSDCPFQAVARHRLGAERWPRRPVGLSLRERGLLAHAALSGFWNVVRDHATLVSLPAAVRGAHIEASVQAAFTQLSAARWRSVPPMVRAQEARRLVPILEMWLALERERPPFVIRQAEQTQTLRLEGLCFRLRPDRIDTLDEGGLAIVDYKTGRVEPPRQWFDERPRASQLGLYTLAQRDATPALAVRAVAYAELGPDEVAASGLADAGAWPGLDAVAAAGPCTDWVALESWWRKHLGALAAEIARGHAAVTPRASPLPCRNCGLHALCRIESVRHVPDSDASDE